MIERIDIRIIDKMERALTPPRERDKAGIRLSRFEKEGCYPYIPLYLGQFIEQMKVVEKLFKGQPTPSFVDVGCGIGTKSLIASYYGFIAYGVEIDPRYAEVAMKLIHEDRVLIADAMKHDFSAYDVIYFYCPFADEKKEMALERHLVETAKSGAVFMANLKRNYTLWGEDDVYACDCKEHNAERRKSKQKLVSRVGHSGVFRKL